MRTRKICIIYVVSLCIALIGCSAANSVSYAMDMPENGDGKVGAVTQIAAIVPPFPLGRGPQGDMVRIDNFVG